jgi:hypothetical protein
MPVKRRNRARVIVLGVTVVSLALAIAPARAQHHARRTETVQVFVRARPVRIAGSPTSPTLGTFMPTPYITVRGNDPVGGGYSPLGIYGDQTMSLYGPLSPLRPAIAPVVTYTRGYGGEIRLNHEISSSYPILPSIAPVNFPTSANYYYGPRVLQAPWWSSAINWIDQN